MNKTLFPVAAITALSITAFAPLVTAGQSSSVDDFDICSLLSSGEASSITGDQNVVKRGGSRGFLCAWASPTTPSHIGHDIVIMFFTKAKMQQINAKASGLGEDPAYDAAFHNGSPLGFFQAVSKKGKSCQGYSGKLPCTEVEQRIVLYKHTNAYDYVVFCFAQRNEGGGDAGLVRLVLDATHVANLITSRLP
jgi:hypothetical protein